jgi:ligand-binding sensor domain-containing protein/two-component sensor histidine kinase
MNPSGFILFYKQEESFTKKILEELPICFLEIVGTFRKMFFKKPILLICFCVLFSFSNAQQVNFIKYTVYDGLVANPVRCIYQDSKGFIWIGTFDGLSRYDGYKFTNYTTTNGLSHTFINSLFETDNKLLIAENDGSVDVIENNVIQKGFKLPSAVNFVAPYKGRHLLTTDTSGFYEYKNGTMIRPVQDMTGTSIGHFTEYNDSLLVSDAVDNSLFVFTKHLAVYSTFWTYSIHFYSVFKDSRNRVWACTSNGLKLLQLPTKKNQPLLFQSLSSPFNLSFLNNSPVTSMIEEKDGSFWIGTIKGLLRLFPDGSFQLYNEKDGLPSSIIYTIYRDREDNLWIGTALGLAKWVSKNNIVFYNSETKEFKNDVNTIHLLPNKELILNTEHGLQKFNFNTKKFTDVKAAPFKYYMPVSGSFPLFVHFGDKLGVLDEAKNTIRLVEKLSSNVPEVYNSFEHPSGTRFIGSGSGLFAVKNSSVQKILPHRITCLIVDKDGYGWAGSWQNGLFRIKIKAADSTFYDVQDFTSLIGHKEIRSLYEDSKKNIWVGTRYGGAFCLTAKKNDRFEIQHFNRQSGLMSDWVKSFAETQTGDIWIGTYLGLDRLVKEPSGYRIFNFSKAVNFFAQIENIISPGNNTWICVANKGIAYFKDEAVHQNLPLKASILSASLGVLENKLTVIQPKEKVSLKPNQNAARFEFSALGFTNEKQVMYSYRLKGSSDTTWSKPENIHEASYASLSPGHYTFEVKTAGWNGEHGTPATFSFFISTPFWKQWWFISLGILAVAIFFYALYQYRIRQLLRLQNVRNSIATDLHDDIGSSLTNISILSELSSKNLSHPEKAQPFLQRISEEVQASSQAMDDIIWSVNSHNDSLQETMARMRRYAAELFDNSETNCHLKLDENAGNKKLSMEQRRDVYLIYKEALNNIHKHAWANNVWIEVIQNQNHLYMQIKDDGKGFNSNLKTHRNGLKNLRSRVEKWNGKIHIHSEENKGTAIEIKIPLRD